MKWVGGKARLLPALLQRLPRTYGRYYEPFAGGAALFFKLAPERAVLGDANADLIAMYRAVSIDVEHVIDLLRGHQVLHSESHYYAMREAFNRAALPLLEHAAAFLYLNRVCFNGLWRVNASGHFNVPIGAYKNPTICNPKALRAAAAVLGRTELRAGDYRDCLHDAREGDLVYIDPPYDDAFNAYTPGGSFNQAALAETASELVARGCYVVLSNSDTPLIQKLYRNFQIERVRAARSVNADGAGRGDVDELIITNRSRKPTMHRQTEIPGTQAPDTIPEVAEAIYDYLNAKTEQSRVTLEARGVTKTKHGKVEELFGEHKIDSHPYTCPKTGKPKRFWFTKEAKAKSSSIAVPRVTRGRRRGGPRRDVDAEIAGEPREDNVIEMRRVPRKSVEKEIDGFGSVRERMEQKQVDAAKQAGKTKRKPKNGKGN